MYLKAFPCMEIIYSAILIMQIRINVNELKTRPCQNYIVNIHLKNHLIKDSKR
jgi:hypothetical protein